MSDRVVPRHIQRLAYKTRSKTGLFVCRERHQVTDAPFPRWIHQSNQSNGVVRMVRGKPCVHSSDNNWVTMC